MKVQLRRCFYDKVVFGFFCFFSCNCFIWYARGGTKDGDVREVKELYVLENIDHSNEHFSMNPLDQLKAVKDMRAKGIVPLGNFHSHPESPSRPSEEDKRLAYDKEASYMIISIMNEDEPVLKSFRIVDNVSNEEEIEYI